MSNIEMTEPTADFAACWQAAAVHLSRQSQGPLSWLKANLTPPFLEHLSFRMGNQLFFVRVEDADGEVQGPGGMEGLLAIAKGCNGRACLIPMKRGASDWAADYPGWGLVDVESGYPVIPPALVSDEKIEITDWELHDFGVQTVRDHLRQQGRTIMSSQGNPSVDPSLWFIADGSRNPEWVVVRVSRHPTPPPELPDNIDAIAAGCACLSDRGHFASVAVANADDPFLPNGDGALPLWRGYGMHVRFHGLRALGE